MERFGNLCNQLTQIDSSVNIDALLDALQVLFDECNTAGIKKTTNVPEFLQKYGKILPELRTLRPNRDDFEVIKVIGRGAFGEVQLVQHKATKATFAMKCLSKFEMLKRSDTAFYWQEREVMALSSSEWIVGLHYSFQDEKYLYLVMDFVAGGDLVTLISKYDLTEDMVKFYMAEAVLAVDELHRLGYIHRDIKPDNMLLDSSGHVKLADFGTCIRVGKDGLVRSDAAIGTPDYISPEVLESQNGQGVYGVECDWWSVGVMMFELLYGDTPFYSDSLLGTYGQIMNHHKGFKFPDSPEISSVAKDLIKRFITGRDDRIGKNGVKEIQAHPFFKDIDWANLRKTTPPVVPDVKNDTDTSNFEDIDNEHIHNEHFPTPKTFSGNHLPFIGYTFARQHRWKIVAADGSELPQLQQQQTSGGGGGGAGGAASGAGDEELLQQIRSLEREKARMASEYESLSKKLELEIETRKLSEAKFKADSKSSEKAAREQASALKIMKEIEGKNQDLEKAVAMMKLEVKEANRKAEEETKARKRLQNELAEARESAEDTSALRDLKRQLEDAKKKLEDANDKYTEDMADAERNLSTANKRLNDLQVKYTELEKNNAVLDLETKELTAKLSSMSSTKADGSKKLEDVENLVVELKKQLSSAIDDSLAASERARTATNEVSTLKKTLASEMAQKAALQEEVVALEKAKATADKEVRDWTQQAQTLSETLESMKKQNSRVVHRSDSEVAQSEATAKELSSLKSQLSEMTSARDKLRSTVAELEHKLSMAQIELKDLERQSEKANKQLKESTSDIEELKAKLDAKQSDFVDMREKVKQLEGSKSILSEKIESLNSILETERSSNRELQNLYNSLAKSNVTTQIEIKELNRKLTTTVNDLQTAESKLVDCTAKLEEKSKSASTAEESLAEVVKARDSYKAKFEELKALYDTDILTLSELQNKYAGAEKMISLLEFDLNTEKGNVANYQRDLEDARQDATTQIGELQDEVRGLKAMYESLETERQRLEQELTAAYAIEKSLQEERAQLKSKLSEAAIQNNQLKHVANLAMSSSNIASKPSSRQSISGATPGWMDKKKSRDQQQELRKLEKKFQEEVQISTKLKMQVNAKEADILELREQIEELVARCESLERTHPKADQISLLSVSSSRKGMEGFLKIPKDKTNLKLGWKKQYVVASALKVFIYEDDKDKSSLSVVFDLSDVLVVRKVNAAEVTHCSPAEVETIFQLVYKKKGELSSKARPVSQIDSDKIHASKGHEFISTHFNTPTWCHYCNKFIFGLQKQGYTCRKCNYISHKKCYEKATPCSADLDHAIIYFMSSSSRDRDNWIQCITSMKGSDLSPTPSRRSTVQLNVSEEND